MNTLLTDYISQIKDKQIHIIGLASSECANIALFLQKHGIKNVTLHQNSDLTTFQKQCRTAHEYMPQETFDNLLTNLQNLPYPIHFQEDYLQDIADADIIFTPQSWYLYPANNPLKDFQDKLQSITQLYLSLSPATKIAITGTNGKTTTSFLTHHILKNHPTKKCHFTGNDRQNTQCLLEIETHTKDDLFLLEVSNRQLHFPLPPVDIACLTNITPQHLDEYPDFNHYKQTKFKITNNQSDKQHFIYNQEDEHSQDFISNAQSHPINTKADTHFIQYQDLQLKGAHNLCNARMAATIAILTGMDTDTIQTHMSTFTGCAKRQELVATIDGVNYYDDTTSTSDASTIKALQAFPDSIFIMGGNPHGGCDTPEVVKQLNTKLLILIESPLAIEMIEEIQKNNPTISYTTAPTLSSAILQAKANACPNEKVVLCPCAQYYIYFRNKVDDHASFKNLVKKL